MARHSGNGAAALNVIPLESRRSPAAPLGREEAKAKAHARAKDMSAEWLISARAKKGLTQAELGNLIGVSGARISQLENPTHRAPVSLEILCEISHALDVPLVIKRVGRNTHRFGELSVR